MQRINDSQSTIMERVDSSGKDLSESNFDFDKSGYISVPLEEKKEK